jgi:monoamine oxidase
VKKHHVDVVVVRAGFAGMIAARNLRRAGKTVAVLEARDRIGGRIKAGTIAGKSADVGGIKVAAEAFVTSGGMHGVAEEPAKELGDSIALNAPVKSISQHGAGVRVLSDAGEQSCDYVVVAVPLPLCVRIAYDPPLPAHRDILAQRMPMGSTINFWSAYERPFWRDHPWNGLVFSDVPPSAGVYDGTLPEGGVVACWSLRRGRCGEVDWAASRRS